MNVGGSFSVRFLRNGDQIILVRDIINESGAGAALMQVVDPNTGIVTPSWKNDNAANQPIVRISVRSAAGYTASIQSVRWAYDGTDLQFTYNGASWVVASNDARFKARINDGKYELRVVDNLASKAQVANKLISYSVDYISNAMAGTIDGSVDVYVQPAGNNSHTLQITTNRVELDNTESGKTATLTAVGYYGTGTVSIGSNGYTVEWYQDGKKLSNTTASITVTRDMVNGGSVFTAKLLKDGNVVATDGQRISDIADEYQISYTPTSAGANYVGPNHNATYNLSLLCNGSAASVSNLKFAWSIYNALGVCTKSDGTGSVVTITPSDCLMKGDSYGDVDVVPTATWE